MAGEAVLIWEMEFFAAVKSAMMRLRVTSASILSCVAAVVDNSSAAVTADLCAWRAESSSGYILWKVARVVIVLTIRLVLVCVCKLSGGTPTWFV